MDIFEFVMILVSIVVGLGLSSLLIGAGDLLKSRHLVRVYPPQLWQGATVLLLLLLAWWRTWRLSGLEASAWRFGSILLLLGLLLILFVAGHLVFSRDADEDPRAHYFRQFRLVYGLLGFTFVLIVSLLTAVFSVPLSAQLRDLAWSLPFLALAASSNERLHRFGPPLLTVLLFIAALIEAFFRQLVPSDLARWSMAGATGLFWTWYFFVHGRRHGARGPGDAMAPREGRRS